MIEIIPSILVKTREEFLEKIMAAEKQCERVHVDVADGIFVPNMTVGGFEEVKEIETTLKIGAHLMVSKPENHIVRWLDTPVDKVIFHIEATKKAQEIIATLKEAEKMVGIALNPSTPLEALKPIVDSVDFIHFMTVEPGFYGGKYIEAVIEKINDCRYFYPDKLIEVDGGITPENAAALVKAGANMLVVGSYLWQNGGLEKGLEEFKKQLA
ncbi:MAG: ribulose-phosphate 3-epimerase [bacterium]|nr:ribulose-phosphate 3-epimerase [bacterium]